MRQWIRNSEIRKVLEFQSESKATETRNAYPVYTLLRRGITKPLPDLISPPIHGVDTLFIQIKLLRKSKESYPVPIRQYNAAIYRAQCLFEFEYEQPVSRQKHGTVVPCTILLHVHLRKSIKIAVSLKLIHSSCVSTLFICCQIVPFATNVNCWTAGWQRSSLPINHCCIKRAYHQSDKCNFFVFVHF